MSDRAGLAGGGETTAEQRGAAATHWFEPLAEHMGSAYHRYSFTKGTEQEVEALIELLAIQPGDRILDVGCGPGRHALALASRGFVVVGVDISERFVELARSEAQGNATFEIADARDLSFEAEFDAVISLCQGAFGLAGGSDPDDQPLGIEIDEPILSGIARAVRPGGRIAVSAFSAYFQMRFLEDHDTFDARTGVNHEQTEVRDDKGVAVDADLWTTCFTPRELRLLARQVGLVPNEILSVTPGSYGRRPPSTDEPEFLLLATRP